MRIVAATLALGLMVACGDGFHAVQQTDTIEAYEEYVLEYPTSRMMLQANTRLEELYLDKAKADAALEGYDRYLERFPEGVYREKAMTQREDFLFDWAKRENTEASWQTYLGEYPRGDKDKRSKAQRFLKVAQYRDHLEISEVAHAKVNLAEDPNGPLNGEGFTVQVKNVGDKTLDHLSLTLAYIDDDGEVLNSDDWPVVSDAWSVPIEEERKVPMKPGQTRTWEWTTGDVPERWTGKTRIYPSNVRFAK